MAKEIAFENGSISNFEGLMTLTLTLDRVILHTVVDHVHLSTSTTCQISLKSTKLFVDGRTCARYARTDGQTNGRTFYLRPALLGRLCHRVDIKSEHNDLQACR